MFFIGQKFRLKEDLKAFEYDRHDKLQEYKLKCFLRVLKDIEGHSSQVELTEIDTRDDSVKLKRNLVLRQDKILELYEEI